MMSGYRQRVLAGASRIGAQIVTTSQYGEGTLYSPRGTLWLDTGSSTASIYEGPGNMEAVWEFFFEVLESGTVPAPAGYEGGWWDE